MWNQLVMPLILLPQYYYLVLSFPHRFNNRKCIDNNIYSDLKISVINYKLDVDPNNQNVDEKAVKIRAKRQNSSGAGKYADAARMGQMKILQLYLQLFKNLWASSYVGGSHPMHPDVPKPVMYLFKDKIVQKFFPDVGEERQKKSH